MFFMSINSDLTEVDTIHWDGVLIHLQEAIMDETLFARDSQCFSIWVLFINNTSIFLLYLNLRFLPRVLNHLPVIVVIVRHNHTLFTLKSKAFSDASSQKAIAVTICHGLILSFSPKDNNVMIS